MSTPTEEGKEELTEDQLEEQDSAPVAPRTVTEEQVASLVEKLAPQPEPPAPEPRQMRFTVICACKIKLDRDRAEGQSEQDIAAVHIMSTDKLAAQGAATQLLGANVRETAAEDWDPVIVYLGHQELL